MTPLYFSVLLGLLVLQGLVIVWLLNRYFQKMNQAQQTAQAQLLPQLQSDLQRPFLDLTERLTRLTSETQNHLNDRLHGHFRESQERLERSAALSRQEQQASLHKSTQALETRFQSLETQVGIRLEGIGKSVENKLNENLKEGFRHFEKVQEHLQAAEIKLAALGAVGESISDLNQLLKLPHLRGGFGEAVLERLLADFLPTGSFELQAAVVPGAAERVDALVQLASQKLPIDSKFPREQVLPLFESQDPAMLEQARKVLGEAIRIQAKNIAEKYIRPDHGTTDMALLFLPSETLYFEVTRNGKLFEDLSKLKVYPVSPNTLMIGLRSVMLAQEYYDMSKGVEKTIEDVQKARKHFDHFERKFGDIGKGLKKAQEAYEVANTHLGRYESSIQRLTGEESLKISMELPTPDLTSSAATLPSALLTPQTEEPDSQSPSPDH